MYIHGPQLTRVATLDSTPQKLGNINTGIVTSKHRDRVKIRSLHNGEDDFGDPISWQRPLEQTETGETPV